MTHSKSAVEPQANVAALAPYLAAKATLIPLNGKAPVDRKWTQRTYDSDESIRLAEREGYNLGFRIPDGWLVVDYDPRRGDEWKRFCAAFKVKPKSFPCVKTGGGGKHLYMRLPPDMKVRNSIKQFSAVEFKGIGHQVVAAGSVHPTTGQYYVWIPGGPALKDAPYAPLALVEAIRRKTESFLKAGGGHCTPEDLARALSGLDVLSYHKKGDLWFKLMCSAHHATGGTGFSEFVEWCLGDLHYRHRYYEIQSRWDSLDAKHKSPITYLFINKELANLKKYDLFLPNSDFFNEPYEESKEGVCSVGGLTFQLMSSVSIKAIDWLWPNRIAAGKVTMLAGMPGVGKGQIACHITAVITHGGKWPYGGGEVDEPGGVIWLSAEDDAGDTLKPRLQAAKADESRVYMLSSMVKSHKGDRVFSLAEDIARLDKIVEHARERGVAIRALVLDPVNAYMGSRKDGDKHSNSDVRAILTPLKEWAAATGIAVIAITHFNKSGKGPATYQVIDSVAFTATARGLLIAAEHNGERVLVNGKQNIGVNPGGLTYAIEAVDVSGFIVAPRIKWTGQNDYTADEVASHDKAAQRQPMMTLATHFLADQLVAGPKPRDAIFAAAKERNISEITLKRAQKLLSVESQLVGFGGIRIWRLPPDQEL